MSTEFAGGEIAPFIPSDANATDAADSGKYDPAFCRGAVRIFTSSSYAEGQPLNARADIWLHCDLWSAGLSTSAYQVIFIWYDGSGTASIRLSYDAIDVLLRCEYWSGSAWVVVGTDINVALDVLQTLDLHCVVNSVSGSIDAYISGTHRLSSGTINLSGITSLKNFRFYGVQVGGTGQWTYVSQCIVRTTSTVGARLGTIVMTGNGANTAWTNDYTNIDEFPYSDADSITSGTATQVETYLGTPVPTFTGYVLKGICVASRTKKSGGAPTQIQQALRSAGTTYFTSTLGLDFGYSGYMGIWETNPATSADFLSSEVPTLEYGQKSIT